MSTYPNSGDLVEHAHAFRLNPTFESPPYKPISFKPEWILHRVLTVRPEGAWNPAKPPKKFPLRFQAVGKDKYKKFTNIATSDKWVRDYIKAIIRRRSNVDKALLLSSMRISDNMKLSMLRPSPYDIDVFAQCYIILELDVKMNWRFTPGTKGVTTHHFHEADNFGLTFWDKTNGYSNPVQIPDQIIKAEDCQILYFRVARRRNDEQKLNFNIEFMLPHGKFMPLIFDPDVPNGGGASFP